MLGSLLPIGVDRSDEEADAGLELGGGALEGLVVDWLRDAPVEGLGARELAADLAPAVPEADHVVEALARELVEVLGAPRRDVDAALAHHAHGVGVERLGAAARARRADGAAREVCAERLGHLRARAVAGAQEQ